MINYASVYLFPVLVLAAGSPVAAQEFPAKPVRAVVPFNPGGDLNVLVRVLPPPFIRAELPCNEKIACLSNMRAD